MQRGLWRRAIESPRIEEANGSPVGDGRAFVLLRPHIPYAYCVFASPETGVYDVEYFFLDVTISRSQSIQFDPERIYPKKICGNLREYIFTVQLIKQSPPTPKNLGRIDYTYNAIGQLTEIYRKNASGALVDDMFIEYDVTGKVTGVYNNKLNNALTEPAFKYVYDDRGFRSQKVAYNSGGSVQKTNLVCPRRIGQCTEHL